MEKILVTGATGAYGAAAVELLLKKGCRPYSLYAMARDTSKISHLEKLGVNIVYGDYNEYDSLFWAFTGIDKLLFVSGTETRNRAGQHKQVVKAAKRAGVKHIIYTSQMHKTDSADSPIRFLVNSHLETENAIKKSGMRYTILRNGLYLDLLPAFLGGAFSENGIFLPAGNGNVAFALRNDLAEAAAAILLSDNHKNKTYNLCTGNVTFTEIARLLSEITAKEVCYTNANFDRYIDTVVKEGIPRKKVLMLAAFAAAIAQGELEGDSMHLQILLGRQPLGVTEFLWENYGALTQNQ